MALPTIPPPPTGQTADDQARNEYLQALSDAMRSIEKDRKSTRLNSSH